VELSAQLQERGVDLVVLDQKIDTSTAMGRMSARKPPPGSPPRTTNTTAVGIADHGSAGAAPTRSEIWRAGSATRAPGLVDRIVTGPVLDDDIRHVQSQLVHVLDTSRAIFVVGHIPT
jgi:hypothetical protein